jgi:GH25 family lysozyme M1 (1,4-beta-N-acetylmuramidase)
MIRGIDLSANQGEISDAQWQSLATSGIRFAYLRCGVGNDVPDTRFAAYVAGAKAVGIVVGAYHFAYPLPDSTEHPGRDPESQCQAHFEACSGLGSNIGELPMALDAEWPVPQDWGHWGCAADQITEWLLRYLAKAKSLYGRDPIVYTYPDWAGHVGLVGLDAYRLWIASYESTPTIPAPWTSWSVWQSSGGTSFKLPNGAPCDEDQIADEATLASLLA